jgi:hypothetical protein
VVFAIDRIGRVTLSHGGFGSEGFNERMRQAIPRRRTDWPRMEQS